MTPHENQQAAGGSGDEEGNHHHSLPDYPDEIDGGGANHLLMSTVNTTKKGIDDDGDISPELQQVFGVRSVFGQRAIRRAHTVLTITLAVVLMAVLIQNANNKHQLQKSKASATSAASTTAASSSASSWLPLPDPSSTIHSIAFGSCMKEDMPQPFWDTLVRFKPDVTILGGDNVYMAGIQECQEPECHDLKKAYDILDAHPSFAGAKAVLPMVAQLDDHDYGQNDGWKTNPFKDKAKSLFLDWMDEPADSRRRVQDDGLYTYYEWGPVGERVQLILLDTRYSRSGFVYDDELWGYVPDTQDKTKRMLSHKQWHWLEHDVLSRPANVRLVFSTIQVMAEGEWGFEGWNKIPHELHRLKKLLVKTCLENEQQPSLPILLSGDRHMGAYYYDPKFNLHEVTASSFTHTIPAGYDPDGNPCKTPADCIEKDPMRVGGNTAQSIVWVNHFGLVEFHWGKQRRVVNVNLVRAETSPGHPVKTKWEENSNAGEVLKKLTLTIP